MSTSSWAEEDGKKIGHKRHGRSNNDRCPEHMVGPATMRGPAHPGSDQRWEWGCCCSL